MWTITLRTAFLTTWWTTESAFTTAAFGTTHPAITTFAHALRDAGDLRLVNHAICIPVHGAKALLRLLGGMGDEFFPADLAVRIRVR